MGLLLQTAVLFVMSTSTTAFMSPGSSNRCPAPVGPLFALPRSRQTAQEAAVLAEWEQLSELQRRIEDGAHYEHWPETRKPPDSAAADSPVCRGVFCGYRATEEERNRLKSADPEDAPLEDVNF